MTTRTINKDEYYLMCARIRGRLERDFPIGCRVRLSEMGRRANIVNKKHLGRSGRVVGYYAGVSPKVLWDNRKTESSYAAEFLERE